MALNVRKAMGLMLLVAGIATMTAACVCFGRSFPKLGERPLNGDWVIGMRCGAVALAAAAQAALLAGALPLLLRPRSFYRAAGWSLGVVAALAASSSAALLLAR